MDGVRFFFLLPLDLFAVHVVRLLSEFLHAEEQAISEGYGTDQLRLRSVPASVRTPALLTSGPRDGEPSGDL